MPRPFVAVILAAGEGRRMGSTLPKPLHEVAGRPMIDYVLDAVDLDGRRATVVVVGHGGSAVADVARHHPTPGVVTVVQAEQLGTAHAVATALDAVTAALDGDDGDVLVALGDTPLLRAPTLAALLTEHGRRGADVTVLSMVVADPTGYGRVVRDDRGDLERIVEERDATPDERRLTEVNTGVLVARAHDLTLALARVGRANAQGEYYLTDVVGEIRRAGGDAAAWCLDDPDEGVGVNDPGQLEYVRTVMDRRASTAE